MMKKSKVSAILLPAFMIFDTAVALTTKGDFSILSLGICAILMGFGIGIMLWIDAEGDEDE